MSADCNVQDLTGLDGGLFERRGTEPSGIENSDISAPPLKENVPF
jgi:hypothetical protein